MGNVVFIQKMKFYKSPNKVYENIVVKNHTVHTQAIREHKKWQP
jgi:hypothetical protein